MAHIHELLEAKHERDRQGPAWPGAGSFGRPPRDASKLHAGGVATSPTAPAALAHERGEQGKRGKG